MKAYIEEIIVPYVKQKRAQLKLNEDHPVLAIFDVFKGRRSAPNAGRKQH